MMGVNEGAYPVPAGRRRPAETIVWPNLGYADAYAASFEVFDQLQQEAGSRPACVSRSSTRRHSPRWPGPRAGGRARRRRRVRGGAVRRPRPAAGALPHDRARCSGTSPSSSGSSRARWVRSAVPLEQITPGLVRCVDQVPDRRAGGPAPLLRRLRPPALHGAGVAADAGRLVNAVGAAARRPISWASFTVPRAAATPLLRAAARPDGRPGDRTGLRARPVPPGRSGRRHDGGSGRAHRRRAACPRPGPGVGGLHRVRDGSSSRRGRPTLLDIHREILAG